MLEVNETKIEAKKIKWNININQKALIDNGINISLEQAVIYDFIYDFIASGSADQIIRDSKSYSWIAYQYIIDALPILNIKSKETIARHINKLIKVKLLNKIIIKEFGNKTFFCIGDKSKELIFGIPSDTNTGVSTQKSKGIDSNVERVSTKKSNNSLINDSNINTYINIENEYFNIFNSLFHKQPIYNYSANRSLIKQRLKEITEKDIILAIKNASQDNWFVEHGGFTLMSILKESNINKYLQNETGQKNENIEIPECGKIGDETWL